MLKALERRRSQATPEALSSIGRGPAVPPVSNDIDLDDLTSEDLIELAQVDLIGRRHGDAIIKLSRAVALGSSSGCELLANLLSKGLQGSTPTTCSPPQQSRHQFAASPSTASYFPIATPAALDSLFAVGKTPFTDPLAPAHLYIRGLELELASDIQQCVMIPLGLMSAKPTSSSSNQARGSPNARPFDLDKILDLVIGLVGEYRYGRMRHDHNDPTYPNLWARGCQVTQLAVLHPDVTTPRIKALVAPSARPRQPCTASQTWVPNNSVLADNRVPADPESASRSELCPSRLTSTRPRRKVVVTLQLYLLYLLALQAWHRDEGVAELYWTEIVDIAQDWGGHIGTKAGDEIVAKAMKRLARDSGFESWKREIDCTAKALPSPPPSSSCSIDWASTLASQSSATTRYPVSRGRNEMNASTQLVRAEPPQSALAKGFFSSAHLYGYPSPPNSERGSPPTVIVPLRISDVLGEKAYPPSIAWGSPNAAVPPARSLRRVASSASIVFAPPRLIRRVASSASLFTNVHNSTVPHCISGSTWRAAGVSTASSNAPLLPSAPSRPEPSRAATWSGALRRRVSELSMSAILQVVAPTKPVPSTSAAASLLRQVLQRNDDAVASAGMWEDSDLLEDDHESEVYSVPSSPPASSVVRKLRDNSRERSLLSRHRSYVTLPKVNEAPRLRHESPPPAMRTPLIICTVTPPTPTKEHLLPPRPHRRTRSSRSLRRVKITVFETLPPSPFRGGADDFGSSNMELIDPFLLELERNSRVGVATVCDGCGANGLNYPACPRCDKKYCARACRVGSAGRHRCS
ncbi:BQ2448_2471 [Microbotryum intermedium]|uniref:BQ2448_2471 protein n=1 Tax=Microbotryum intermedium TaxID=269621 RepID=A0A238FBI0_9BASI|nr:BQ2448_2471 [Microbotryum intermedium]